MGDLIVVEKVVEESQGVAVDCHVLPHPNVAYEKAHGTISSGGVEEDKIMASRKLENFETYLNSVGDEKTVQIILLQIAHAFHHIHLQELVHGDIRMENLRISESKTKVVLVQPSNNEKSMSNDVRACARTIPTKHEDIKDLGKLFKHIGNLKPNFHDKISEHLCMRMMESSQDFSTEKILQHPYFWSTEKKLRFLSITAQRFKEEKDDKEREDCTNDDKNDRKKKKRQREPSYMERKFGDSLKVFDDAKGWIGELEIRDDTDKKRFNKLLQGRGSKLSVTNNTVKNLAEHPKQGKYNERHLWSLLNFIRNQSEHYWEKESDVKACFLFDPLEGYWNFFNTRYSKLLPAVYDVVADVQEQIKDDDIYDVYFETMALNQDLPAKCTPFLEQQA